MRRLAVTVGEVVAVVAITPSWWLVRNLTKVMGGQLDAGRRLP
jgi:hypothetical protein